MDQKAWRTTAKKKNTNEKANLATWNQNITIYGVNQYFYCSKYQLFCCVSE